MRLAIQVVTVSALLFASSSAFAAPLKIKSAVYGTATTGRTCDATGVVAGMCDGRGACDVYSGNQLCSDPDVYVVKSINITFQCGRTTYRSWASEYTIARANCP